MPAERPTILATSMGFNRARDPWQPSPIFRYAFALAGNPTHPKLCFLTTGTGDRKTSIDSFYAAFQGSGVNASHLSFFEKPNTKDVSAHLHEQDVIWVDRGSLANLLAAWRAHALDRIMRDCWQNAVWSAGNRQARCVDTPPVPQTHSGMYDRSPIGLVSCRTRTQSTTVNDANYSSGPSLPDYCRMGMPRMPALVCTTKIPILLPPSPTGRKPVPTGSPGGRRTEACVRSHFR